MLKDFLWVGCGGFLGSMGRYAIYVVLKTIVSAPKMVFATFAANMIGCLLIGLLAGLFHAKVVTSPSHMLLWSVGFLGGFTTFSTFSLETLNFIKTGQWGWALANITLSLLLGLALTYFGFQLTART